MVRAESPDSPSVMRTTLRSPRWWAKKSNTSAATTSSGSFSTTLKKVFRSKATARNVLGRVLPATNSK